MAAKNPRRAATSRVGIMARARRTTSTAAKATIAAVVATIGLVVVTAAPAFAHSDTVNGSVTCAQNTSTGTWSWTIDWSIYNDWPETEVVTLNSITGGSSSIVGSPFPMDLAANPNSGDTGTLTQTLPLTTTGTDTLDVHGLWSPDGYQNDFSGSVTLPVACPVGITTSSSAHGQVPIGTSSITDTATVTGNSTFGVPTGKVDFYYCYNASSSPTSCTATTGSPTSLGSQSLGSPSGDSSSATSSGFSPSKIGYYCFFAHYEGSTQYSSADENLSNSDQAEVECFQVVLATPSISTTPNPTSATVGAYLNDSANVTGGDSPTGTVTFYLFSSPSACSTTNTSAAAYTSTDALSGGSAATDNTTVPAGSPGTWVWLAKYNGDTNNAAVWSNCTAEQVTVGKASPSVSTSLHAATISAGGTTYDTANVTGGDSPTGTVWFRYYSSTSDCSADASAFNGTAGSLTHGTAAGSVTLPASPIQSSTVAFSAGSYYWAAFYSGDANNNDASSNCTSEPLTVNKVTPAIDTVPTPGTAAGPIVGVYLNDSANVTGGDSPTGTVTFYLFAPGTTCSTTNTSAAAYDSTDALSGGSAATDNTTYASDSAGTWTWLAEYNGDTNNNSVWSNCVDEQVTVGKDAPSITTVASPTTGTAGVSGTFGDTATFSGTVNGAAPTGSVGFALYAETSPGVCASTALVSGSGSISTSGGVSSASFSSSWTPPAPGTYSWIATYAGDANNDGFTTKCGDANETVTVVPPTAPTTVTTTTTTVPPAPQTPIQSATTVHTGEPWAGSGWIALCVLTGGLALVAIGGARRRAVRRLLYRSEVDG